MLIIALHCMNTSISQMKTVFGGVSGIVFLCSILQGVWLYAATPSFLLSTFYLLLIAAWLLIGGYLMGTAIMKDQTPILQLIFGSSLIFAIIAIIGSGFYYLMPVPAPVFYGLHLLLSAGIYLLPKHEPGKRLQQPAWDTVAKISALVVTAAIITIWIWLGRTEIITAVRSPWDVLSPAIIIPFIFLLAAGALLAKKQPQLSLPISAASLFSLLIIPSAIYPLGFGFDPFVHAATMQHIAEFGTITPKPLYYIGKYANGLYLHHLFAIPFETFNRFFIPAFAAIVIPAGLSMIISNQPRTSNLQPLTFLPFLLPLSLFITTTPQALGFLFAFLAIAAYYIDSSPFKGEAGRGSETGPIAMWIFALAALLTHPIAGVPTILFCAHLEGQARRSVTPTSNLQPPTFWLRHASTLLLFLTAISLPLTFLAQSLLTGAQMDIDLSGLFLFTFPEQMNATTNSLLGGAYLFINAHIALFICAALIGYIISKQSRYLPLMLFAGALLINYLILASSFTFSSVIAYESNGFAERLLPFAVLILLPVIAELFRHKNIPISVGIIILLLAGANIYGTFPRHDNFARSGGFNMALSDIDTVYAIEALAEGNEYAVLANQSVSAAALQEFGFAQYYGDQFYYPIPTSSPLYDIYLEMAESPSNEIIERARTLTGTDLIFFALNHYWWDADRVLEETEAISDFSFTLDDAVTIFVFATPESP